MTDCLEQALGDRNGRYSRGALDVLLTDAYLALSVRRLASDSDFHDHLAALGPGRQEQLLQQLDRLASSATVRDQGARPSAIASESERMAQALERYRRIAAQGGWPEIGKGVPLEADNHDPRVPALRERLAATGDLAQGSRAGNGKRYDAELVQAVIEFQKRHGLEPDGVVGSVTRKALNVSADERVDRMEINLRRIEANAIEGRQPVLRVNIPDYRITLHETEGISFSTRAIVGRPGHKTPRMQTYVTALTLNPAWHVPRSIVRDELAHRFARQDGYAERNGFRAVDSDRDLDELDWSRVPAVAVRQEPGPSNALGRIKFEMPNRRAIYLHDTPEKHLFQARQRAFSAGCVRVEEPMELAARLTGLAQDRLERMARDGATRTLRLGWRIPVQLVYFTAWVDASGRVQFRPDIYDRDALGSTATS